jgi:hypothetical protein
VHSSLSKKAGSPIIFSCQEKMPKADEVRRGRGERLNTTGNCSYYLIISRIGENVPLGNVVFSNGVRRINDVK